MPKFSTVVVVVGLPGLVLVFFGTRLDKETLMFPGWTQHEISTALYVFFL